MLCRNRTSVDCTGLIKIRTHSSVRSVALNTITLIHAHTLTAHEWYTIYLIRMAYIICVVIMSWIECFGQWHHQFFCEWLVVPFVRSVCSPTIQTQRTHTHSHKRIDTQKCGSGTVHTYIKWWFFERKHWSWFHFNVILSFNIDKYFPDLRNFFFIILNQNRKISIEKIFVS